MKFWVLLICGCVQLAGQTTATWTGGGGDNNWSDRNNWQFSDAQCQGEGAPGQFGTGSACYAANVVIPGGITVNVDIELMNPVGTFSLGSGSTLMGGVDAQGNATLAPGSSALGGVNGENVTIASGALVTGEAAATAGTVTNQGTIIGGVLAATVVNSGTIKLVGDGAFASTQGTNTGTIEATALGSLGGAQGFSQFTGPWNNAGGTIQVDIGASMSCDSVVTGGNFNVSPGGVVVGSGNGLTFAGTVNSTGITADGPGGPTTVTVHGTLAIAGNLIVGLTGSVTTLLVNGGVVTVTGGETTLGGGVNSTGQLELNAGSLTTGNLIIGEDGTGYASVATGATVKAGAVTIGSTPSATGQLVVQGGVMTYATLSALRGSFNLAVWVYEGGKLTAAANATPQPSPDVLDAPAQVTGSGSVWNPPNELTMTSTTLTISAGGSMTMPELQVYGTSTVDVFTGSTLTASTSASLGTGATMMVQGGSSAKFGALGVGSQNSASGVATVVAGGMGSTLNASLIQVSGGGVVTVETQAALTTGELDVLGIKANVTAETNGVISLGVLDIGYGKVTIQSSGSLQLTGKQLVKVGGAISSALLDLTGTGTLSGAAGMNVNVYENGTLQISGGDSAMIAGQVSLAGIGGLPLPGGAIDVSGGALGISGSPTNSTPLQQGWVTVLPGGTLKGVLICPPLGTTNGIDTCVPGTVVNGPGTVIGGLLNAGGIVSIDPAILNVTQNFQQSSGTLALQIDGTQAGEVSQLTAGGSIQISGGTVEFDFTNGFAPSSGSSFNVLSATGGISLSGANMTTTGLASGFTYTTSMNAGQLILTATNSGTATSSPPAPPPTPTLTSTDTASGATSLAAGSLATGYGSDLATGQPASASYIWPLAIDGTSVSIVDATGFTSQAPLLYVASTQVDYQIPDTVALGPATVTVTAGDGTMSSGPINVVPFAPGLFEVNTAGLSASFADCVSATGQQTTVLTSQAVNGAIVALPLNLGACQETVLELWTTGLDAAGATTVEATIGGQTANVLYAGPQGTYPGVDQVNVVIPQSLAGAGSVPVVLSVDGVPSNTVTITIQ